MKKLSLRSAATPFPRPVAPASFSGLACYAPRALSVYRSRRGPPSTSRLQALTARVKTGPQAGFVLRGVPEPTIKDTEVLIRVKRAGVCGTDVHFT